MRRYLFRFSFVLLLITALFAGVSVSAQGPGPEPDQRGPERQERGVSAGGNWMVFESEDVMTAAKIVRFELESNNTMPDSDRRSKIVLYCKNGKLDRSDFQPSFRMSGPNRPGFWGQPQMEVTVRVDNAHSNHGWNWIGGRFLTMDKGTVRELIGAHVFRVEFLAQRRRLPPAPQVAEFSPAGLDPGRVRRACDITPKRP